ncbi:MAG: cytochrome [Massilia sp.]|jgi:cytochrome c oxidase cbb3-type subunit 3|nr:cytochrome [Massilia sp.]MDB5948370.1 cytochrome [Massilia sp.]
MTAASRWLRAAAMLCLLSGVAGCYREERPGPPPPASPSPMAVRQSEIEPGEVRAPAAVSNSYEENAYALSQGKSLFRKFNCSGCHSQGGGGMGPALMDDKWSYGSEPANIYATIVQGRPNGMPAFGGHLTNEQVWQLVAYVRSMSGQVREDAAPSRSDEFQTAPPEGRREKAAPKDAADAAAAPKG